MRCAALYLAQSTVTLVSSSPASSPVYPLLHLLSPAHWGPQSSPFLVALASPSPFLLLARAYVRTPLDFFPVFTHRSFFPFRNIIGGAMHLSPFPSPPPGPPPLARFFWRGPCGPARSPRESDFGESWTRAGNSLTRGCSRQEALIARYLRRLTP